MENNNMNSENCEAPPRTEKSCSKNSNGARDGVPPPIYKVLGAERKQGSEKKLFLESISRRRASLYNIIFPLVVTEKKSQ